MNAIKSVTNIATNLIQLGCERGFTLPYCQADVDAIISDAFASDMWKLKQLSRIKCAVHEAVYGRTNPHFITWVVSPWTFH